MNDDIVLAVYIPPQAPWPGQLLERMSFRSASLIRPARLWPYAWNALTTSSFSSVPRIFAQPARIVPP